ncbi:MAG TPA: hypothetical protein VGG41_13785 [Solirubrobacteraceae bacterium]
MSTLLLECRVALELALQAYSANSEEHALIVDTMRAVDAVVQRVADTADAPVATAGGGADGSVLLDAAQG